MRLLSILILQILSQNPSGQPGQVVWRSSRPEKALKKNIVFPARQLNSYILE